MKKLISLEQLEKDGIAQLKTHRQLLNQGIINKNLSEAENFETIFPRNPGLAFRIGMEKMLGKVCKVIECGEYDNGEKVNLLSKEGEKWWWPLEAIAK